MDYNTLLTQLKNYLSNTLTKEEYQSILAKYKEITDSFEDITSRGQKNENLATLTTTYNNYKSAIDQLQKLYDKSTKILGEKKVDIEKYMKSDRTFNSPDPTKRFGLSPEEIDVISKNLAEPVSSRRRWR